MDGSMKARDAHVLWAPADYKKKLLRRGDHPPGSVKVLRFLRNGDWKEAQRYNRDAGASFTDWRHRPSEQLKALVLAEFHALVVSDGMHPQAAHKAFLVIDEYREGISPDIDGADGETSAKGFNPRQDRVFLASVSVENVRLHAGMHGDERRRRGRRCRRQGAEVGKREPCKPEGRKYEEAAAERRASPPHFDNGLEIAGLGEEIGNLRHLDHDNGCCPSQPRRS